MKTLLKKLNHIQNMIHKTNVKLNDTKLQLIYDNGLSVAKSCNLQIRETYLYEKRETYINSILPLFEVLISEYKNNLESIKFQINDNISSYRIGTRNKYYFTKYRNSYSNRISKIKFEIDKLQIRVGFLITDKINLNNNELTFFEGHYISF